MDNNLEVTQEEITNLLMLLIDTVAKDSNFLDLRNDYTNVVELNSLKHWEKEVSKLSMADCKILIPMALIKVIERDGIPIGKMISFIKFILTLTVRFFNKVGDLKCINNLVFLACDNIDTWLLRNLSIRPIPFLNPANTVEIDKWVKSNFILYAGKQENYSLVYQDMNELIELVLDANTKIQLGEPLNDYESDTIINIVADHIRILMEKARHHKGSIALCGYCNAIYYYTHENKLSNQFLMLSPINQLCSECFIEANKEVYKFKDMYVKSYNKETKKELLRYLIFSTDY